MAIPMAACPRVKTTSLRFIVNPLRHTQRRSVVVSSSSTLRDAEKLVTLHPYFRVAADAEPAVKVLCAQFEERTQNEKDALYYHFTWCQKDGDDGESFDPSFDTSYFILFCREAYTSADAVKIHLANVGDLLDEILSLTTLERLEVHGTSSELAELHEALDPLGADFYYANGVAN
ncbi:ABM domain-containing protein [Pseudoscourfieldia marina]